MDTIKEYYFTSSFLYATIFMVKKITIKKQRKEG